MVNNKLIIEFYFLTSYSMEKNEMYKKICKQTGPVKGRSQYITVPNSAKAIHSRMKEHSLRQIKTTYAYTHTHNNTTKHI